jgi:hypothetical protein
VTELEGTDAGATIARDGVAVVTFLATCRLKHAVAAVLHAGARLTRLRTKPMQLYLAGRVATISDDGVGIVALFSGLDRPVSANAGSHHRDTRLARGDTGPPRLNRANRGAAIAALGVAVVTCLAAFDRSVAADLRDRARA